MRATSGLTALVLAVLASLGASNQARAVAIPFAGGGFDFYDGPGGEITRSSLATIGVAGGAASGAATIMRYDDSVVGDGDGFQGTVSVPVAEGPRVRAWGSRFVGQSDFRAWRAKAGVENPLISGSTLGRYYLFADDNHGDRTSGGAAELDVPMADELTGRASAGLAAVTDGPASSQGSVGVAWRPTPGLEFSGDLGLTRNGSLTTSPGPGRALSLPLLGNGPPAGIPSIDLRPERFVEVGMRVALP